VRAALLAGVLLAAFNLRIAIAEVSDGHDRRLWLAGAASVMVAGLLGLALTPATGAWLWIGLFALGNGAVFPLALTLPACGAVCGVLVLAGVARA
jgi:cyanate permease